MKLNQELVDAAIELMETKFPTGSGGAAAMYTGTGEILTSVGIEGHQHDSANLCHETGAILEALKFGKNITASVCVYRESEHNPTIILSPCGMCQERLRIWGENIEVAIPAPKNPTKWEAKTLKELQPYYWGNVFKV